MKNITLRAKRTLMEAHCAPEYADNQLAIEIMHPGTFAGVQELSVSIYSSDYRPLGCDTCRIDKPNLRKVKLDLSVDEAWRCDTYRIYVYCNGRPQWFAETLLCANYEEWDKIRLEEVAEHPEEKLFAEELCFAHWWERLHVGRFSEAFIRRFILRLYHLKALGNPLSHLLVRGEKAGILAAYILASHYSDGKAAKRCRFSLSELADGSFQWQQLQQQMSGKKVVLVEISAMNYSLPVVNFLNLLASLLACEDASRPLFIFYGTDECVDRLLGECESLSRAFIEANTFYANREANEDGLPDDISFENFPLPFGEEDLRPKRKEGAERNEDATLPVIERELLDMVGLQRLKNDMREAWTMALFTRKRKELNMDMEVENRHHMLFFGNPGTGKTTVAKLVGQMYHRMGLLTVGHTVETCRTDLVGEYIGQTEVRTKEAIEKARGGVLFIDEAYTLVSTEADSKDFGKEVIHALLTVLSEPNPDLIVILAGYENKMRRLLRMNPGLRDRFPLHFYFDDYGPDELTEIARRLLRKRCFELTAEADTLLYNLIAEATKQRDEHFGNGRWVHNLIEQGVIRSMAQRVMSLPDLPDGSRLLSTIEACDVIAAGNRLRNRRLLKDIPPAHIGFRA